MMKSLFQKKCLPAALSVFVCALLFGIGCKSPETMSPAGYNLGRPEVTQLGKVLNEISGICLDRETGNLLAVSDSKEQVFEMDLASTKLREYTGKVVPKESDLEDIVKVNSVLYLLKGGGAIVEVPEKATDTTGVKTYTLGLGGTNDFETIYHDPTAKGLVVVCKSCAHEKGTGERTAYRFDLETKTFDTTELYTISKSDVRTVLKSGNAKLDPSAAAIHPVNKRVYMLSSAGNLLVVIDTRGKVAEVFALNPELFPQAEGIAFAQNGDMYITNEAKYGRATLLRFPYVQQTETKK